MTTDQTLESSTRTFDDSKAEAFAERMFEILNSGAIALMTSIGHRTELFDTMATLPPSTSQQIADAAGLNERYVREWLGAMVTGRLLEYNPADKTYYLASSNVGGNLEHPADPILYTISCLHCMSVSLAVGGMGLGAMWGEEKTLEMLEAAGFVSVEIKQLDHDDFNNFYIIKKH